MATDIGVSLFVEGEGKFKDAMSNVNAQLKAVNEELKLAVESFDKADDKEGNLAKQTELLGQAVNASKDKVKVLTEQYDRQMKTLEDLRAELDKAIEENGEMSNAANKVRDSIVKQETKLNSLSSQVSKAKTETLKYENQLEKAEDALDNFGNEAKKTGDELKETKNATKSFSDALNKQFIKEQVFGALKQLGNYLWNVVDATKEYRTIMGTLEVSSTKAGYSAEQTEEAYKRLYGVLGDSQTTATTVANLQALGLEQGELMTILDGVTGAWATYGDSIPIDGLAESVNETVKAGEVTGTFADVLNWAGTNEDEFNDKLAACGSESERVNLILQEFAEQGLIDAAEGWREVNANIVETNKTQSKFEEAEARLGDALSPAVNFAKGLLAELLDGFATLVEGAVTIVTRLKNKFDEFGDEVYVIWTGVKDDISGAVNAIVEFFNVTIPNAVKGVLKKLNELPDEAKEIGGNLIAGLWNGINDKIEWIKGKVKGFCGGVLGEIEDFFGIHSPSTVMRDRVGAMLGAGLAEGITKSESKVLKAADDLSSKLLSKEEELGKELEKNNFDGAFETNFASSDSASKDMDELFNLANAEYDEFMEFWKKKQEAANVIASEFFEGRLKELKDGMTKQMDGYYGEFEDVGQHLMVGVAEGVENGRSGVVEAVKDALKEAARAAREVMDINSPSKVFGTIGKYMAQGISVGFGDEMATVSDDIAGYMLNTADRVTNETLLNAASATVNGMQVGNMSGSSEPMVVQLVLDGRTLAQVMLDPLKGVAKQRGVALG